MERDIGLLKHISLYKWCLRNKKRPSYLKIEEKMHCLMSVTPLVLSLESLLMHEKTLRKIYVVRVIKIINFSFCFAGEQ